MNGLRTLRGAALVLAAAWAAVVAAAFARLEPSGTLAAFPWGRALAGAAAAGAALLACAGGGAALLARLSPRALDDELGWLRALAAGFGAWGLLSLPVAALLGVRPWVGVALLGLLAAGWLLRPPLRGPGLTAPELAWGLLLLLPALPAVLAPISETDELYYHLALPARLLQEAHLLGGPLMPNGSRPLALHLPWTWLLALGGPEAPRAFHLALGAALLLALRRRARAWWGPEAGLLAPLLLLGSQTFLGELGLAHADVPAALLVLLAADAAIAGDLALLALFGGAALAVKYTAALGLVPLWAWLGLRALCAADRGRRTPVLLASGLAALALVAPWWLRNALEGLHPLFPFAGWRGAEGFAFQYVERYGVGRAPLDFLLLPWNLVMRASDRSDAFLGRINPAFLALAPLLPWAAWRCARARILAFSALAGLLLWAAQVQWLRYLLPVLPLAALACAAAVARLPRPVAWLAWLALLAGLPANLRPVLSTAAEQAPVALGLEPREAYLERRLDAWPAVRWLNEHGPADSRVALLFCWQAAPLERPWLLGSVEDHVPTRHFLALHGAQSLQALREAGATHVLVARVGFSRRSYAFLDAESFRAGFTEPEERLQALLAKEAVLMFERGRYAVWRL